MSDDRDFLEDGLSPDGLTAAFEKLKIDLRFNERGQFFEIKKRLDFYNATTIADPQWQEIDEHERHYLRLKLLPDWFVVTNSAGKVTPAKWGKDAFTECLYAATHNNRIDPFRNYLEGLPSIKLLDNSACYLYDENSVTDSVLAIDNLFTDLYKQQYKNKFEWRWHAYVGRLLFLAQVHRTFNPGAKFDEVIVLTGEQGVGKDALFKSMVPWMDLMTTSLRFSDADKSKIEKSLNKSIVVASEMAGLIREADVDSVKQYITAQSDRTRLSYRADPIEIPRRYIIVCTSNSATPIPNDPTGNRRWVVVKLQAKQAVCRVEDWFEQEIYDPRVLDENGNSVKIRRRDLMWAEAVALYRSDPMETAISFPVYLRDVREKKNIEYSKQDEPMEVAWANALENGLDDRHPYTTTALYLAMGIIDNPKKFMSVAKSYSHRLEDLMTGMKWVHKQKRFHGKTMRVWIPPKCHFHPDAPKSNIWIDYKMEHLKGEQWITDASLVGEMENEKLEKRMQELKTDDF